MTNIKNDKDDDKKGVSYGIDPDTPLTVVVLDPLDESDEDSIREGEAFNRALAPMQEKILADID